MEDLQRARLYRKLNHLKGQLWSAMRSIKEVADEIDILEDNLGMTPKLAWELETTASREAVAQ